MVIRHGSDNLHASDRLRCFCLPPQQNKAEFDESIRTRDLLAYSFSIALDFVGVCPEFHALYSANAYT